MEWLVRLEGDEWSLEDLPKWFGQLDHKVRLEDGKYYLASSAFEHCTTSVAVGDAAAQIVEQINGAARAFEPHFRPVHVGEIVQAHDDGTRQVCHRLKANDLAMRPPKLGEPTLLIDDKSLPPPQPSKPEKIVARWEAEGYESDLGRALRIGLLPQQTWGSLYHVYEMIKHDMWGGTGNPRNAWKALLPLLPEPDLGRELERFRRTANDPKHAGIHARHGRPELKPEPNPMTFAEAQSLIRRLLLAWLSTKI